MSKTLFTYSFSHKIIILIIISFSVLVEVFPIYGYSSDIELSKIMSYVLSVFSIGLISLSLYFFNNEFSLSPHKSKALLSIYLLLVLANPAALIFSTFHIVALLVVWALYFNAKFYFLEKDKSSFFIAILLSSIASLIYQPLLWLSLMIFIVGMFYSKIDVLRLFAIFLGALTLPFIYIASYFYLFMDTSVLQYLSEYFTEAVDVQLIFTLFRIEHIVYISVLILILLNVILNVLKRSNGLRGIQKAAYRTCFLFLASLLFISAIFRNSELTPLGLVLYIPISLVFFNYLNNNPYRGWSKFFVIMIILLAIMYRVAFYVDFATLFQLYY